MFDIIVEFTKDTAAICAVLLFWSIFLAVGTVLLDSAWKALKDARKSN